MVCQELCCEQVWPQPDPEIKEIKMTISEKFSFEILEIQSRFLVWEKVKSLCLHPTFNKIMIKSKRTVERNLKLCFAILLQQFEPQYKFH